MKLFASRTRQDDCQKPGVVTKAQRVELMIRGVGRTSGTVEEIEGDSITVALVVKANAEAMALDRPDAVLEYTATRGLYRQKGHANFDVDGGGVVRFVGEEEAQHVQRRDFVRVDVNFPVGVAFKNDPVPVEYDALNLSANGILLGPPSGRIGVQIGAFVWMKIPLYDGKGPIDVRGTAVRQAPKSAVGIRFDHISEGDQERLAHYVARQEREQRRRGAL
ncbi:MAG TPA: PilZ domain-containing protein [Thermoleophilaceae bacterium]|jgi:c-di-GMP-binding flagellar brake protein YcgR|nr:PilZ domain-containing protein [Thermoleophilaceae bacterium]